MAKALRSLFNFIVFSSLYVAILAVLLISQTRQLLHLPALSGYFYSFVFCSTLTSYNFHWYLTPVSHSASTRLRWGKDNKRLQLGMAIAGSIAAIVFLFLLPAAQYWWWIALAGIPTFLYTAPKIPVGPFYHLQKVAIGKTLYLTAVWTYVTTVLPMLVSNVAFTAPAILFIVHRFFFIHASCIVFDFRDRDIDRAQGIRTLITLFDERGNDRLFHTAATISVLAVLSLAFLGYTWQLLAALTVPVIGLVFLYPVAKKSHSDYLYYFVLDGLLILSACLTALVGW